MLGHNYRHQPYAVCQLTNMEKMKTLETWPAEDALPPVLVGKTRMKFRYTSVRISYALLHLQEIKD
jgi:hypothetical protein